MQRAGIDRIWEKPDGMSYTVEIKSDIKAAQTGNVFLELIQIDTEGGRGWVYTSGAQYLVTYVPGKRLFYLVEMVRLKRKLSDLIAGKTVVRSKSKAGYSSHGVPVPISEFVDKLDARVVEMS